MTRKKQQVGQKTMAALVPPLPAPLERAPLTASDRQGNYRQRQAIRNERNAQIANEAMGIVYAVRAMWDMGITLRGVDQQGEELQTLNEVRCLLVAMADPFAEADKFITWRNATVTPSKGTAKPRRVRERVGT